MIPRNSAFGTESPVICCKRGNLRRTLQTHNNGMLMMLPFSHDVSIFIQSRNRTIQLQILLI